MSTNEAAASFERKSRVEENAVGRVDEAGLSAKCHRLEMFEREIWRPEEIHAVVARESQRARRWMELGGERRWAGGGGWFVDVKGRIGDV